MKTLREMMDIVEGKVDIGRISHEIIPQPGGRYQVVIKRGDSVAHTSLHNSEEDAKKSLATQIAHTKKQLKVAEEADSGDYDYDYPYTMSARDKGRYDAMTGREYNNPYSAFGTQEDHKNSIEYSAAYDSAKEQGVAEEAEVQEYTVRVVDEEGSGYTVKVTAPTEQGALHKAIVQVRRKYGAYPEHARIIRQDVEEQASPDAIARVEQLASDK